VNFGLQHGQNLLASLELLCLFIKIAIFIFFFMWVRWTIPRFRYDQLMKLGWKTLIPLAILNMLVTGFVVLYKQLGHF
jgi:NADH-quinone oxidoreductase subunit H